MIDLIITIIITIIIIIIIIITIIIIIIITITITITIRLVFQQVPKLLLFSDNLQFTFFNNKSDFSPYLLFGLTVTLYLELL